MTNLEQQFQANPKLARGFILTDLQTLCWAINEETEYCVFFSYLGHVDEIIINIAMSKEEFNKVVRSYKFYLNEDKYSTKLDKFFTTLECYQYAKEKLTALLPKEGEECK